MLFSSLHSCFTQVHGAANAARPQPPKQPRDTMFNILCASGGVALFSYYSASAGLKGDVLQCLVFYGVVASLLVQQYYRVTAVRYRHEQRDSSAPPVPQATQACVSWWSRPQQMHALPPRPTSLEPEESAQRSFSSLSSNNALLRVAGCHPRPPATGQAEVHHAVGDAGRCVRARSPPRPAPPPASCPPTCRPPGQQASDPAPDAPESSSPSAASDQRRSVSAQLFPRTPLEHRSGSRGFSWSRYYRTELPTTRKRQRSGDGSSDTPPPPPPPLEEPSSAPAQQQQQQQPDASNPTPQEAKRRRISQEVEEIDLDADVVMVELDAEEDDGDDDAYPAEAVSEGGDDEAAEGDGGDDEDEYSKAPTFQVNLCGGSLEDTGSESVEPVSGDVDGESCGALVVEGGGGLRRRGGRVAGGSRAATCLPNASSAGCGVEEGEPDSCGALAEAEGREAGSAEEHPAESTDHGAEVLVVDGGSRSASDAPESPVFYDTD